MACAKCLRISTVLNCALAVREHKRRKLLDEIGDDSRFFALAADFDLARIRCAQLRDDLARHIETKHSVAFAAGRHPETV